jgi:hypothetical protein
MTNFLKSSKFLLAAGAAALSLACGGGGNTFSSTPTPVEHDDTDTHTPTEVTIQCDHMDGLTAYVAAGDSVSCQVLVEDPDPEMVSFKVVLENGTEPTGWYSPESGNAYGDAAYDFTFWTMSPDAGKTFDFSFVATDSAGRETSASLSVAVQ